MGALDRGKGDARSIDCGWLEQSSCLYFEYRKTVLGEYCGGVDLEESVEGGAKGGLR